MFPASYGRDQGAQLLAQLDFHNKSSVPITTDDVLNGFFWRAVAVNSSDTNGHMHIPRIIQKYYELDPVLNVLFKPWHRPPINHIVCAYGVGLKTPSKYHWRQKKKNGHWTTAKVVHEDGDDTVTYQSLSWCHKWLGDRVNITQVPQHKLEEPNSNRQSSYSGDSGSPFALRNVHRGDGVGVGGYSSTFHQKVANQTGSSKSDRKMTFFEEQRLDLDRGRVRSTAVWELDGTSHRHVIKSPLLLAELRRHLQTEMKFVREVEEKMDTTLKALLVSSASDLFEIRAQNYYRGTPTTDLDCVWNYANRSCANHRFCQYKYQFGDFLPSHSCRLRKDYAAKDYPGSMSPRSGEGAPKKADGDATGEHECTETRCAKSHHTVLLSPKDGKHDIINTQIDQGLKKLCRDLFDLDHTLKVQSPTTLPARTGPKVQQMELLSQLCSIT